MATPVTLTREASPPLCSENGVAGMIGVAPVMVMTASFTGDNPPNSVPLTKSVSSLMKPLPPSSTVADVYDVPVFVILTINPEQNHTNVVADLP